ncbi:MAG: hypothetical protein FWF05_02130 [Oscillospiraceae bacterium]|nr:hypothetical protein [Oscillospiraceae bacterium]
MKRIIAITLALLMALTLAACGGTKDPETTTTEAETVYEPETEPIWTEPESVTGDEEPGEVITEAPSVADPVTPDGSITSTTEADKPKGEFDPPENLGSLSKAEQIAYLNKIVNRVRKEKPGFTKDYKEELGTMSFTGVVSAAQGIIDSIKNDLMPGTWEQSVLKKGDGNDGKFLSENFVYELKAGDVSSITSTKSGTGWVIKANIISETNPAKGANSANSRAYPIASRQEVLDSITDISSAITADVNNATLKYHSGYVSITVDKDGKVTTAEHFFKVDAQANSVKLIRIITTDVTAPQETIAKYKDFKW